MFAACCKLVSAHVFIKEAAWSVIFLHIMLFVGA